MKKIILLFAMMLAVVGVQAKKDTYACNVTLGNTKDSNATYDNGSFSWNGTTSNKMLLFDNLLINNVDINKYKYLVVKVSNRSNNVGFRLMVMCGGNVSTANFTETYTQDEVKIDLTSLTYTGDVTVNSSSVAASYSNINKINIAGSSSATGSLSITASDVYLETAEYEGMDITTTINSSSDKDTPFAWSATGTLSSITNNLGKTNSGVIFGYAYNNDDAHGSFDVTGYDDVTVNLSAFDSEKNSSVRLLKGTGTSNVEFTTSSRTLSYTKDLTFTTCASIKAGAEASNCQNVSSVVFTKEFAATSTTAFSIAASTSSTIEYDREFTVNQVSTVCLPFSLTSAEIESMGDFYYLNNVTSGGELQFKKESTPAAYTPYIFVPKTAKPFANLTNKAIEASSTFSTKGTVSMSDGKWKFQGTLNYFADVASANSGSAVYGWNAEGGTFVKVGSNVRIKAFRAYIIGPASGSQAGSQAPANLNVVFGEEEATDIENISEHDDANAPIYNVLGQRVDENYKGIIIKNGKKYLVR